MIPANMQLSMFRDSIQNMVSFSEKKIHRLFWYNNVFYQLLSKSYKEAVGGISTV
jgi:chromosome condensin MukBEF complex kleisin-like MukF subunit